MSAKVCEPCKRGDHQHDRLTAEGARVYGSTPGADAGCPAGIGPEAAPCECVVVLDPIPLRPDSGPVAEVARLSRIIARAEALSWEMSPEQGRRLREVLEVPDA